MGIRFAYFSGVREQITPELVERSSPHAIGGPEPSVILGQLGEQLTGVSFLEIGEAVKTWRGRHGWSVYIEELDDRMRDALATVQPDDYRPTAERWSTIEELAAWPADEVSAVLESLCTLARDAVGRGHHLYCWVML
ncbi:hypothetical protein ACQP2T_11150 [Nonomuraea sp. CA-143628]|uniref:hypothetical protein n=1 Tax=Nonomuraea sp. CA-143628 TaxID=3239997 RepID=UPI003D8B6C00